MKFGVPHRKYGSYKKLCEKAKKYYHSLLQDPMCPKKSIPSKIGLRYRIPRNTAWRWVQRWEKDDKYDPSDMSFRGKFNRIFTKEQETNLSEHIVEVYCKAGRYFPDFAFQSLAFEFYDEIYRDDPSPPAFNCSAGFIHDFKKRNNFSSRLAHFRQRPMEKNDQEINKEIENFKLLIKNLIEKSRSSNEPVINSDETGFQILPTSIKTWAIKNASNVSINVADSDKDRISIMASITSEFEKLPLFIIGKGTNREKVEEELGEMIGDNEFTLSAKSYMNTECFCQYLEFLRKLYPENQPIHLIIDSYSSHTSKVSKEKAESLNIQLYFIPSHFTDMLQPLDIAIFAPLKSMANKMLRRILLEDQISPIGMSRSIYFLQTAWEKLPRSTLENAWELYL